MLKEQKEGEALEKRMDRKIKEQEDALKIKKIKLLAGENKYDEALDVIGQLDVSRIKLTPTLCMIGDVYMHAGMYDKAEEVLVKVYNKTPSNRRILSLLTTLYTDMGEYSEAEYYYKEFIGVASKDVHRYILRYQLDKAKGERMSVLIDTLERLKDYEYEEEWAYELAQLYHKSGDDKKAIKECNEIILWFGHGLYVNKAIALKCSITGEPVPFEDENDEDIYTEKEDEHVSGLTDTSIDVEMIEKMLREQDANLDEDLDAEDDDYSDADASAKRTSVTDDADDDFDDEITETLSDGASASAPVVVNDTDMVSSQAAVGLFDALSTDSTMDFWGDIRKRREQKKAEKAAKAAHRHKDEDTDTAMAANSVSDIDDDDFEDEVFDGTSKDGDFDVSMLSDERFKQSLMEESLDDDDDFDDEFSDETFLNEAPEDAFEKELFEEHLDVEDEVSVDEISGNEETDPKAEEADTIAATDAADDLMYEDDDDIVQERSWTEEDKTFIDGLFGEKKTQTQKDAFSDVPDIDYVKEQLSKTFTKFEDADIEDFDILADYDINFVVLCNDSSMKAQISLGIAKALNTYGMCDKTKIFRASADDLNKRDFSMIFDRLQGGCLIIDEAGQLSDQSAEIIEKYVDKDNQQIAIILSETRDAIMQFWKKHQTLRAKFLNVINVSKYNEMELVTLAKGYIDERKYELDEDAALVLRDYFKRELDKGQEVNYDDVIEIVDLAISNLEKRNVRNLYMTVLDNKYEEAKMFRLLPQDFKILM
jgi:tetratricopeptide (TPR) repeat protein